jgi:hypothetical protein
MPCSLAPPGTQRNAKDERKPRGHRETKQRNVGIVATEGSENRSRSGAHKRSEQERDRRCTKDEQGDDGDGGAQVAA